MIGPITSRRGSNSRTKAASSDGESLVEHRFDPDAHHGHARSRAAGQLAEASLDAAAGRVDGGDGAKLLGEGAAVLVWLDDDAAVAMGKLH